MDDVIWTVKSKRNLLGRHPVLSISADFASKVCHQFHSDRSGAALLKWSTATFCIILCGLHCEASVFFLGQDGGVASCSCETDCRGDLAAGDDYLFSR